MGRLSTMLPGCHVLKRSFQDRRFMQGSLRVIQSFGAVALVDAMVVLVAAKHGDDGDVVINNSVVKYPRRRASGRLLM